MAAPSSSGVRRSWGNRCSRRSISAEPSAARRPTASQGRARPRLPFQLATRLLAGRPGLHRALGYVYMVSVVVAALAAIVAATFSVDGISVQVAFYLLSAAWLYTLFQRFRAIRQGQIQLHRIWLIRNYALSFAAVAVRAFIGLGVALQGPFPSLTFDDIYTTSVWASILVCAVVAEYVIIHRTLAPLVRKRSSKPRTPTYDS
ncbi:DUF2306 domain-containing protein [Streptomyces sp. NBC_01483]|uniref:DUF2306 domain-containing protein n=1 Tax=Streptomyces sp. NBC_01483 TaxID=2903883 RepID=UPI002E34BDAB|nr:DUF2306 domain-containing protein [Streptomyces sp. NBC_01483]